MSMTIIGSVDKDRLFCSGSFTKLVTTYVCLSLLSEQFDLKKIIDDKTFFDTVCVTPEAKEFLTIFQHLLKSQFTLHDICSYYAGLPYTFDVSVEQLKTVDAHLPFKLHSILDERMFLSMCKTQITPVYTSQCKFHYSELSIIFLGYIIEKIYNLKIETLYQKYIIDKFKLSSSVFSRTRPKQVYCQDLSDKYDYPSIAILDHGFFCYSNGFYTTLQDMKILLEHFLKEPVFHLMVDIHYARAASNRLLNGLTVELRLVQDDIIYGYEGLSYSGCNIWAYSTKQKQGYITFSDSEEEAYDILYGQLGYTTFDRVPDETQKIYTHFIKHAPYTTEEKSIPLDYQGDYQRVNVNQKTLHSVFHVGNHFIVIRNPDEIKYDVIYVDGDYRIKCKDNVHGSKVGFITSENKNKYMYYDGTLYRKK